MAHRIDRYEIVRKIATGGMADVFLALQWGDGGFVREVVVKRLHPHLVSDTRLLEDFRNEADLLARLGGHGIPHAYEFRCSTDGQWYLAMERLRGPTISELVSQTLSATRLPLDVTLSIGLGLCRILDDVHNYVDPRSGSELGVVHGDLTPSNVVTDAKGGVHLLDFGLAGDDEHRMSRMGGSHGIRGTVGYFAPEVAQSQELPDRRADVFSVGALLYELVTGQEAFSRVAIEYINAIRTGPASRPCEVDGSLAPSVDDLLMRCLEPDPKDRPATTKEVADAIIALAAEENLQVGRATLADYVDSYFPAQEDVPTRVGDPDRRFVIPLPTVEEVPDGTLLSADERDELLADLALFAPDGAAFMTPPAVPEPAKPPPPPPPVSTSSLKPESTSPPLSDPPFSDPPLSDPPLSDPPLPLESWPSGLSLAESSPPELSLPESLAPESLGPESLGPESWPPELSLAEAPAELTLAESLAPAPAPSAASSSSSPPEERAARENKETPVAFPAVSDIVSSRTAPYSPQSYPAAAVTKPAGPVTKPAGPVTKPAVTRPSESRRRPSVHPDSNQPLAKKTVSDDSSDGFYIYVAEED